MHILLLIMPVVIFQPMYILGLQDIHNMTVKTLYYYYGFKTRLNYGCGVL